MVSLDITIPYPKLTMADKKSIFNIKATIKSLFNKNKKKNKIKNDSNTSTQEKVEINDNYENKFGNKNDIDATNDKDNKRDFDVTQKESTDETDVFTRTKNEKASGKSLTKNTPNSSVTKVEFDEDEELKNFSFKIISNDRKDSESSQDSGYREVSIDEDDLVNNFESIKIKNPIKENPELKVTKQLEDLKIEADNDKKEVTKPKKKTFNVSIARGPIRHKDSKNVPTYPYAKQEYVDLCSNQINQIHTQTYCGGTVIINVDKGDSELQQLDSALEKLSQSSTTLRRDDESDFFNVINRIFFEEITTDHYKNGSGLHETSEQFVPNINNVTQIFNYGEPTVLAGFNIQETAMEPLQYVPKNPFESPNPIDEFANAQEPFEPPNFNDILIDYFDTPPSSNTSSNPVSPKESSYTSDGLLPLHDNNDMEKCQEIESFGVEMKNNTLVVNQKEMPTDLLNKLSVQHENDTEVCQEVASSASDTHKKEHSLKYYKDRQKELIAKFSKEFCCQSKKPSREVFKEYIQSVDANENKKLCLKTASLDTKDCEGLLLQILMNLPQSSSKKEMLLSIFFMVCERVLAQTPEALLEDFGLNLLKLAVLRCNRYPIVTQYVVDCIKFALKSRPDRNPEEPLFTETDALGDNLILACARGGDAFADVLYLLVAEDTPKLFDIKHYNAEGYSALHVACATHSGLSPKLHTIHVLLTHADVDIWQGDIKGGDTPIHFAVNSTNCELDVVLILFKHLDRTKWKKLASVTNRGTMTPVQYARSAMKSRQNYPWEIHDFLKRCR